jgi:type I restriction enzyme S subunit
MSKLDELIQELCPDGVEYKTLNEIGTLVRGKRFVHADAVEKGVPCIHYGEIYTFYGISTVDVKSHIREELRPKMRYAKKNDVIIVGAGENNIDIGVGVAYLGDDAVAVHDACYIFQHKENPVYISYCLRTHEYHHGLKKYVSEGKICSVSADNIGKMIIPVPPLQVQREIVRILDSFTLLTAELTAELTARKKQYEYYRDELLKPKADIPMVTLKEIATDIYRGSGIKRDEVTQDGIPCVRYGEIYTTYNTWFDTCVSHTHLENVSNPKYFEHGDVLFAITGESVDDIAKSVAYVGNEKCLAGGDIVVLKHNQNPRYLAHVLATKQAREQKSKGKVKSKVVHSNVPSIEQITIPLPSLEVQERYADVLDNFEKICNDLNIGLPAEIEARQKQYEYYRDMLLTFAETGSTILTDRA